MRVTNNMIDPELRVAGRILRMLVPQIRTAKGFCRTQRIARWLFTGKRPKGLQAQEVFIPRRDGGTLRLMVYKSLQAQGKLTGLLWLHGGGYVTGMPEAEHAIYRRLIATAPCVIVAPDYRLAPDHPYPAALEDCYDALLWLRNQAAKLEVREDQIAVAGASAGGGLTAAVTLLARDRGEVRVAFQMPLYPMIDDRMQSWSAVDNDAPGWDSIKNRTAWQLYLGPLFGKDVPAYAAPARATDYRDLPPTCTFVGSIDPFADETRQYAQNLKEAGVPVAFAEYVGGFHTFEALKSGIGSRAVRFYRDWFAQAVKTYFAPQ